jgi:antitoxin component YwqK of YwqJK toxin-antitoxin module
MKKLIALLITLFFACSSFAQSDILIKNYYENGEVKEVLSFNDKNQLDGTCFSYTPDGLQISIASYKDGVKHGEWKIWRENGALAYEMYYENGEKVGTWKQYDEAGNLIKKRDFS